MVVLTEMTSVFWGVILEGGKKKYTQTTEKAVHISMAALDPTKPCGDGPISVKIEHNSGSYVLCTLLKDKLYQQPLNLEFAAGEEISFIVHGLGSVHLSGFIMQEDNYSDYGDNEDLVDEDMESDDEEVESDEDEDEAVIRPGKKRQLVDAKRASKRAKITLADLEDDEDDSDDDDFIVHEAEETNDDDDDEDDDEEEEEEESDDEEPPKPVGKKNGKAAVVDAKINSTTPTSKDKAQNASVGKTKTATTPNAKGTDKSQNTPIQKAPAAAAAQPKEDGNSQGKKKKKKNKNKKNKTENQQQTPNSPAPSTSAVPAPASKVHAKRVAEGGVVIEDVKQGHGPEAQLGKKVAVYYTGRLLNGKVFDCCTSGNGFKFKLGKKEVITGWDVGVKGMKVGGKRTLVIPPKMGYGSSAAGPIPANSTLVFDVELKAVN